MMRPDTQTDADTAHDLCSDPDCEECLAWYRDEAADRDYQDRIERTGLYER